MAKTEALEMIRTTEDLDGSFETVVIDKATTMVVRVEDKSASTEKATKALRSMNPFESLELLGNVQYLRNIVSKFSRGTGRKFSVKQLSTDDGVLIREDWQSRKYFNSPERWNWLSFVASMSDVMNESKIKDEAGADAENMAPGDEIPAAAEHGKSIEDVAVSKFKTAEAALLNQLDEDID